VTPLITTLLVGAAVFGLDFFSKQAVMARMTVGDSVPVIPHLLYITYTRNPGAAYGLLSGNRWLLATIALAAVLGALYASMKLKRLDERIALGLLVAGAAGNLVDRMRTGLVTDFIEIRPLRWVFQIFNVADLAITTAVVIALLTAVFWQRERGAPADRK